MPHMYMYMYIVIPGDSLDGGLEVVSGWHGASSGGKQLVDRVKKSSERARDVRFLEWREGF